MNPNTGEVLAMANWPGFNPEDLQNATSEELENRATGFTYEPGSTFKAFTVASALMDHVVTPSSSFYLPSEIHVYDRTIGEAEPRPPETLTTAQILAQSSNVGAVTIGLKEGADRFSQWINRFGFGQPDRRRLSRRGARDRPGARPLLRLHHGQPADRPGPVGDPDADGDRLLGDRGRRNPARVRP